MAKMCVALWLQKVANQAASIHEVQIGLLRLGVLQPCQPQRLRDCLKHRL